MAFALAPIVAILAPMVVGALAAFAHIRVRADR